MSVDDETLALVVLASLEGAGPARLKWLLDSGENSTLVLEQLRNKKLQDRPGPQGVKLELINKWSNQARRLSEGDIAQKLGKDQIVVLTPGHRHWPIPVDDPDPPLLLFARGDLDALKASKVAIVGTRRCSSVGRKVARQLGSGLTDANIGVTSGLALGIDREAHIGALASSRAKPVAVLGTGVDVCYPARNQSLYDELLEQGLILSEFPPGAKPRRWQFPARNRIIAALSDATIVVESHLSGGSLLTADESIERGKPVLAVPGSLLSASSAGTNRLLQDGAELCLDAESVIESVYGFGVALSIPAPQLHQEDEPLEELIMSEARSGSGTLTAVMSVWDGSSEDVFVRVQQLVNAGRIRLNGERLDVL